MEDRWTGRDKTRARKLESPHHNWSGTVQCFGDIRPGGDSYRLDVVLGKWLEMYEDWLVAVDWLVFTRFNTRSAREYRDKEIDTHDWRTICISTMDWDYITILILILGHNLPQPRDAARLIQVISVFQLTDPDIVSSRDEELSMKI